MFHTDDLQVINNPKKIGSAKLFAFEVGDKILSDQEVLYTGGGGGANTAVSLAKLGLKTALVGAVGDDSSAAKLIRRFKQERLDLSHLQIIKHYWTGLSFVIFGGPKNDRIIFRHRAANDRLRLLAKDFSKIKTPWYYLTSLSGSLAKANQDVVFAASAKNKVLVAWNPGAAQLKTGWRALKPYLKLTAVLILNREEAQELVLSSGEKNNKIAAMAKILSSAGPKIVSISNGPKGAYVYSGGQLLWEPALNLKPVNTTGAGDAFGSSLVGGLIIYRGDLKKALQLALIRSSQVVTKIGAQEGLLTLTEVKRKYHL